MAKQYTPIHIHTSRGSLFDSAIATGKLVDKLKAMGFKAASISDHGSMNGCLQFYNYCKDAGIKPIIGCEFYINNDRHVQHEETDLEDKRRNRHVVLFAKDKEGYSNLMAIQGEAVENGFYYKPRTTWEMIVKHSKGLICTTACMASEFSDLNQLDTVLERYKRVFGADLYLELQFNEMAEQHTYNKALLAAGKKYGVKCIYGLDAHYLEKDDWHLQQILYCLKNRMTIKEFKEKGLAWHCKNLYVKDYEEVIREAKEDFRYDISESQIEELLDNTNEIADKCDLKLDLYQYKYPKVSIPKNFKDAREYFKFLVYDGFKTKLESGRIDKSKFKQYKDQIDYEIDIIAYKGKFADYFILYKQIVDKVYELGGMVGTARGSAAGSLASYCLGITNIDPLTHNLYFSRFLNEERLKTDSPDIDTDIDSDVLADIEDWLKSVYGTDKVCHIANFTTFKAKSLIKDIARVLGVDSDLKTINKVTKDLVDGMPVTKAIAIFQQVNKDEAAKKWTRDNIEVFVLADKLQGCVRNVSAHASGRLLTPGKLYEVLPIQKLHGDILTGYQEGGDEREVTQVGGLKLDLLGLNTCTIIRKTVELISSRHGNKVNRDNIYNIPLDDPQIFKMFREGDTLSIFQFESDSMKSLLRALKVDNIDDVILVNGAFRPAIIQAGGCEKIVRNKFNPQDVYYCHPILKEVLGKSYGIPVFQETFMEIFVKLGGFTMAEADKLRKTIKLLHKENQSSEQKKEYQKFIDKFENSCKQYNISDKDMEDLLKMLSEYSNYAFNKSHSTGYGVLGYVCMWLKCYYPLEFYTSLFNRINNDDDLKTGINKISKVLMECKKKGIKVNYFNVQNSQYESCIVNDEIHLGYNIIKGLGPANVKALIDNKPSTFKELIQLCVNDTSITKKTIEILSSLKVLDYGNAKAVYQVWEAAGKNISKLRKETDPAKKNIILDAICNVYTTAVDDFTELEVIENEQKYLGFNFRTSKLELFRDKVDFNKDSLVFVSEATDDNLEKFIVGEVVSIKNKVTKNGKNYKIVSIGDGSKVISFKVWSNQLKRVDNLLKDGNLVAVKLNKDHFGYTLSSKKGEGFENLEQFIGGQNN